jgi:hypothetical protein
MLLTSSPGQRKGQALLLVTTAIVPMIALVGLVADVGYMYYIKNSAQAAADSAALAAVYRYQRTIAGKATSCASYSWICLSDWSCPATLTSASNPTETACLYAKQNGFDPADAKKSVSITSNVTATLPTAPGVGGAAYWITVRVRQSVPQLFSAVMGNTDGTVVARASAAFNPGLGCVYALDPTAPASFTQNGSTQFKAACGVYVNSNDPAAMLGVGGATLQTSTINVVGGYDWQGTISPTPNTGVTAHPDPLAYLEAPVPCSATGGCPSADCSQHPSAVNISGNTTLFPGTYCGGIRVKNGTATFSPGTYIIVGGGVSTQDTNSHVVGNGVFFYNTYKSGSPYKAVDFNANSSVQLAASSTGDYAGVLFMQDRTCCASTMPTESFQGGATSFFEGILYMPRSLVQFAGNPTLDIAHYTVVIARRFSVQGTSTMNNDFSHLVGGNPIKQAVLVE